MSIELRDLGLSYTEALHAVQSATAAYGMEGATPKHLRVGVDSSLVTHFGLCKLLIDKGVFTQDEYMEAIRLATNEEVARWQDRYPNVKFR